MLDEECALPHREGLVPLRIGRVVLLAPPQRVAVEQVDVDQHRQRVLVGRPVRKVPQRVIKPQVLRGNHLGGDEVRCSLHLGRELARNNEAVDVDHACATAAGVDQDGLVRQVGMRPASHVHAPDRLRKLDQHLDVGPPRPEFPRIQATPVPPRCEPLPVLHLALDLEG